MNVSRFYQEFRISGNECKVVAYGLAFGLSIKPMLLKVNVVNCFLQLCYLIQYGINMLCRYSQKSSVSGRRKEGRLFRSHRLWHADRGKHSEQHVYHNQEFHDKETCWWNKTCKALSCMPQTRTLQCSCGQSHEHVHQKVPSPDNLNEHWKMISDPCKILDNETWKNKTKLKENK